MHMTCFKPQRRVTALLILIDNEYLHIIIQSFGILLLLRTHWDDVAPGLAWVMHLTCCVLTLFDNREKHPYFLRSTVCDIFHYSDWCGLKVFKTNILSMFIVNSMLIYTVWWKVHENQAFEGSLAYSAYPYRHHIYKNTSTYTLKPVIYAAP